MPADSAPPSVRAMPGPGDTIDGKYALLRVLGRGGMGVVFEAEHLRLKQRCAIKMLLPEMLRDAESMHRFEREARASALLKSPHVARVTDVATTPQGVPYIVMELLEGRDLDAELEARGALPLQEAVDCVLQACGAVSEAHVAGIIHRDLKPGNLFLARQEESVIVKVLDFGISKMVQEETKLTSIGESMGTVAYMSPEQVRSAAKVDAQADVWSLGVILYELLCGSPPFSGSATQVAAAIVSEDVPSIAERRPVPPDLAAIIHRALRRSPAERFSTVAELAASLAPFALPDSVGAAVAAQLARRTSDRQLPCEPDRASARRLDGLVDPNARTMSYEASTSAPHEVETAMRHPAAARRPLVLALSAMAILTTLGAAAFGVTALRRPAATREGPSAASGAPSPASPEPIASTSAAVASAEPVASSAKAPPSAEASASQRLPRTPGARPTRPAGAHPPAGAAGVKPSPAPTSAPRPPAYNPPFIN